MKRITPLVVCLLLACGCSDSTPVVDNARTTKINQQSRDYGKFLLDLRNQARTLESQSRFAEAAQVWKKVVGQVSSDFGDNSWQAINARVAYKLAIKKQDLQEHYSTELNRISKLETEIVAAHRAKNTEQALKLCRRLLAIQKPLFGDVSMETARLRMQIGSFEYELDQQDLAVKNLHAGIEIFRGKGIELHPELESALASLAEIYAKRKKFGPAVANQKSATRIAGNIWGTDSVGYANQANQLGVIFHQSGNHKVAAEVLKKAKQIRGEKLGTHSFEYAQSCLNLGIVALANHKLDEAEEQLTRARQIFIGKKESQGSVFSIRSSVQLATTMMLKNRPDITEKILKEVIESNEQTIPREELADYRYKLSIALARQGKYKQAEPMLLQVLAAQTKAKGASSSEAINSMKALAKIFEATHQTEKLNAIRRQLNQTSRIANSSDFQPQY